MKNWPALDVSTGSSAPETMDLLLAAVDDYAPSAVEESNRGLRIFFPTPGARDAALGALSGRFQADAVDVPDDDWGRRSQQNITPVAVGRITIAPPWHPPSPESSDSIVIVIEPSMGFGTGHHATTRLCLMALQSIDVAGKSVLDLGTGSGVLAIAARRLGAAHSLGVDSDADAIAAARDSLALNRVPGVTVETKDLMTSTLPTSDVVVANLTGALLLRAANHISQAVAPSGVLIVSGLLESERPAVREAFGSFSLVASASEDGWAALTLKRA